MQPSAALFVLPLWLFMSSNLQIRVSQRALVLDKWGLTLSLELLTYMCDIPRFPCLPLGLQRINLIRDYLFNMSTLVFSFRFFKVTCFKVLLSSIASMQHPSHFYGQLCMSSVIFPSFTTALNAVLSSRTRNQPCTS